MSCPAVVKITVPSGPVVARVATPGPPGPPGPQGPPGANGGLPNGGNPGDIILKTSYSDGDADWASTLDGGTFF